MRVLFSGVVTVEELLRRAEGAVEDLFQRPGVWSPHRKKMYLYLLKLHRAIYTPFVLGYFKGKKIVVDGVNRLAAIREALARGEDWVLVKPVLLLEVEYDSFYEVLESFIDINNKHGVVLKRCDLFFIDRAVNDRVAAVDVLRREVIRRIEAEDPKHLPRASCITLALVYAQLTGRKIAPEILDRAYFADVFYSIISTPVEGVRKAVKTALEELNSKLISAILSEYKEKKAPSRLPIVYKRLLMRSLAYGEPEEVLPYLILATTSGKARRLTSLAQRYMLMLKRLGKRIPLDYAKHKIVLALEDVREFCTVDGERVMCDGEAVHKWLAERTLEERIAKAIA